MARKKHGAHGGGHGWYVTFADLMGLLMSFFVILAASSTQDKKKAAELAGSMRDAFGVQPSQRQAGIIELEGLPIRPAFRFIDNKPPPEPTDRSGPKVDIDKNGELRTSRSFAYSTAAATLRQALQDMPDYGEISRNVLIEDTPQGLNLQLLDQDGRSMFAEGTVRPYERTRRLLETIAPALKSISARIAVTGHTAAPRSPTSDEAPGWALSVGRAAAVRDVLSQAGVPTDQFYSVTGRADTDPLFPDDPQMAANRRVSILLMNEAPPVPPALRP